MQIARACLELAPTMTRLVLAFVAALLAALVATASSNHATRPLRVWVTPALQNCAASLFRSFSGSKGVSAVVQVSERPDLGNADILLGIDSEMTHVLEGGFGDERSAVRLGTVPWVLTLPSDEDPPPDLSRLAATPRSPVAILGGVVGREARAALALQPESAIVSQDVTVLSSQGRAVLPRTLAVGRKQFLLQSLQPLTAVAVALSGTTRAEETRSLLEFLSGSTAGRAFEACGGAPAWEAAEQASEMDSAYAQAVLDWWVPGCSLAHNSYSNPQEVLGRPDAASTGGRDRYRGMISLGQGGWVVVDMGEEILDRPGAEVRVYQTTSGEPVSLYAADLPAGPFRLVGLMRPCGIPSAVFSNHCDFDFAAGGVSKARYLRVEDGEIYPCLAGTTSSEGADIDAVSSLR